MRRDLQRLSTTDYDLLIIGAGVHGASLAYYASKAGQKVAIIDANDFASGSSSSMQRIIHGGLRYIQKADISRLRTSVKERRRYMSMFPQWVNPLACVVPTKGFGIKSKAAMWSALQLYNICSMGKNKGMPSQKIIANSQLVSQTHYQLMLDDRVSLPYSENAKRVDTSESHQGISGGAKWFDGYCHKPERVVIDLLHTAYTHKASIANYIKADRIDENPLGGLTVNCQCQLTQKVLHINAKKVVSTAGNSQWYQSSSISDLPNSELSPHNNSQYTPLYGMNLVVPRLFKHDDAMGFYGKNNEGRGCMYFVVSEGIHSIIGTHWTDKNLQALSDDQMQQECEQFLNHFNDACIASQVNKSEPIQTLVFKDVRRILSGFIPAVQKSDDVMPLERSRCLDANQHGISNFYDFYGIKFTTAMHEAILFLRRINIHVDDKITIKDVNKTYQSLMDLCQQKDILVPEKLLKKWHAHYAGQSLDLLSMFLNEYQGDASKAFQCEIDFVMAYEMAVFESDCYLRRMAVDNLTAPNAHTLKQYKQHSRLSEQNKHHPLCYNVHGKVINHYP